MNKAKSSEEMSTKDITKESPIFHQREFALDPRCFQNKDKVKVTAVTGGRNLLHDRHGNHHVNYQSSEIYGDRLLEPSTKYSRWDNSKRSRRFAFSDNTMTRAFSDSSISGGDQKMNELHVRRVSDGIPRNGMTPVKTDFKTLLTMFLKRSSIYALNQIGHSATVRRKVFWSFIMIFGLLGSGFQIIQFLGAYFSYPVVVNMDSVSTLSQEFPAVTVCNLNTVRREFLPCLKKEIDHTQCNVSEEDDIELTHTLSDDANECNFSVGNISGSEELLWRNLFRKLSKESVEFYGHQKEDFIVSCSYNGEQCTADDFSSTTDYFYGNCFTFNAPNGTKPPLNTSYVGANSGLELELDLEVDKYAPFTAAVGTRVEVHDPYHTANIDEKGVNVSPGFETSITLTKSKMLRLPYPYKDNCITYGVGDSMQACMMRCVANITLTRCSCVVHVRRNDVQMCDLSKLSDLCCIFKSDDDEQDHCKCPLSCEETDFLMNIFSAVWPSEAYNEENPVQNPKTGTYLDISEVRKTRLVLKVYYDSLETSIYIQKPMYQTSELFSQIGGQMGLWLGLSLVAIFECIENFVLLWRFRAEKHQ